MTVATISTRCDKLNSSLKYLKFQFLTDGNSRNAFLHLWSLSVESQFYLVFPFIFLVTPHLKTNNRKASHTFIFQRPFQYFRLFILVQLHQFRCSSICQPITNSCFNSPQLGCGNFCLDPSLSISAPSLLRFSPRVRKYTVSFLEIYYFRNFLSLNSNFFSNRT